MTELLFCWTASFKVKSSSKTSCFILLLAFLPLNLFMSLFLIPNVVTHEAMWSCSTSVWFGLVTLLWNFKLCLSNTWQFSPHSSETVQLRWNCVFVDFCVQIVCVWRDLQSENETFISALALSHTHIDIHTHTRAHTKRHRAWHWDKQQTTFLLPWQPNLFMCCCS